jgi:predicted transcriptional regulator
MAEPGPSIFDEIDPDAEKRAMEEAERAIAEGRVISHEAMVRWLRSWGTPDELPPPKCGE